MSPPRIIFSTLSPNRRLPLQLQPLPQLRSFSLAQPPSTVNPSSSSSFHSIFPQQRPLHTSRPLSSSSSPSPTQSASNPHRDFYKTHGRALFKALTLAFFSYQVVYWAWLSLESEEIRDQKNREIKSLETEVRMLDGGRRSHLPAGAEKLGMGKEGKPA